MIAATWTSDQRTCRSPGSSRRSALRVDASGLPDDVVAQGEDLPARLPVPAPSRPATCRGAARRRHREPLRERRDDHRHRHRRPSGRRRLRQRDDWATAWCARTCTPASISHHGVVVWPMLLALAQRTPRRAAARSGRGRDRLRGGGAHRHAPCSMPISRGCSGRPAWSVPIGARAGRRRLLGLTRTVRPPRRCRSPPTRLCGPQSVAAYRAPARCISTRASPRATR